MSQELVTIGGTPSTEVAAYHGASTGLEDVRIKPTNLILVQNGTREPQGARPGQILDVLTGQAYDQLEVVPLRRSIQRVMFPPGELDLDAKPICRSSDGVVPSPFAEHPQALRCATCQYSQWKKVNGVSVKPRCSEKYRLLVIKKDEGVPRYLSVGGMGIAPLKLRLEAIKQDVEISRRKGTKLDLFDYFFTLTSDEIKGKTGRFYVLRFDNLQRVKNPSEFGPLFEEYVVRARHQEDEEEGVVENETKVDSTVGSVITPEVVEEA